MNFLISNSQMLEQEKQLKIKLIEVGLTTCVCYSFMMYAAVLILWDSQWSFQHVLVFEVHVRKSSTARNLHFGTSSVKLES